MNDPEAILRAAEDVIGILKGHRLDAVVIGAVALAAHHYVRQTEDLDLGVNADLPTMRALTVSLRRAGFTAELKIHHPCDVLEVLASPVGQDRLSGNGE